MSVSCEHYFTTYSSIYANAATLKHKITHNDKSKKYCQMVDLKNTMQAYYFCLRKKYLMKLSDETNQENIFHVCFCFSNHACMNIPSLSM